MGLVDFFTSVDAVSVDEALGMVEKEKNALILLDVREPDEYEQGHMPGAQFIPLSGLADRTDDLDASKKIVTYCKRGPRSRSAAALLKRKGFSRVVFMDGGMDAWRGLVATGSFETGLNLLEGRDTLEDLVALAWSLEEGTGIFYNQMKELVSDEDSRNVFDSLVKAEKSHKARLMDVYRQMKGDAVSDDEIKKKTIEGYLEGGESLENVVGWIKKRNASGEDILEISMQLETNSLDLYMKMATEITDTKARSVFQSLIDEEKVHLAKLGKLLGSMIKREAKR